MFKKRRCERAGGSFDGDFAELVGKGGEEAVQTGGRERAGGAAASWEGDA